MTNEELEEKWRKEAEELYPYAKFNQDDDGLAYINKAQLNGHINEKRTAYVDGCSSRQAEVEALTKEISEMTK